MNIDFKICVMYSISMSTYTGNNSSRPCWLIFFHSKKNWYGKKWSIKPTDNINI